MFAASTPENPPYLIILSGCSLAEPLTNARVLSPPFGVPQFKIHVPSLTDKPWHPTLAYSLHSIDYFCGHIKYKCELETLWLAADLVERAQIGRVSIRSYENGLIPEGRFNTLRSRKRKLSQM